METRANYAMVGLFTLGVIAAAFLFVYWFARTDSGQSRQDVRIVFSGSVSGLSRGSPVLFNGIRVGELTEMNLLAEDPRRVVGKIEVDRNTPIRTDTRARLEFQGLTGTAQVALVGGEPGSPPLTPGPGQPLPTIFADRSDFQDLLESARNIARRADDVLERVNRVVTENEGSISRSIQNAERFSQALGENAPAIDRFLSGVGQAAERIGPLAQRLDSLVQSVDPQRLASTVENIQGFTQALADNRESVSRSLAQLNRSLENTESFTATLAENRQNVATILRDGAALTSRLNETTTRLDAALTDVSNLTRAIDAAKVNGTIANVEGFTATLAQNRENVANLLRDSASLTGRLNETSVKLDAALTDVSNLTRAIDAQSLNRTVANVEGFSQTLAENRQNVANILRDGASLTTRLNEASVKLETALTDVGNLAKSVDASRINRTVGNLEGFTQTLAENRDSVANLLRDAAKLATAIDAQAINRTVANAERFTATLGNSSDETEKTIANALSLTDKLNKSADRIDGVLRAAEGFLGSAAGKQGEGLFGDIREAARAIRVTAENLDKRTAEITASLKGFTGPGLREVEALAAEGRRAVNEVNRAVRSLERNPQQLLFGGQSNVPEYNGRR